MSRDSVAVDAYTLRELTQALTQHYKDASGDQRHVPATLMAVETVRSLMRIVESMRHHPQAAGSAPVGVEKDAGNG